jgi:hypothetical protein
LNLNRVRLVDGRPVEDGAEQVDYVPLKNSENRAREENWNRDSKKRKLTRFLSVVLLQNLREKNR